MAQYGMAWLNAASFFILSLQPTLEAVDRIYRDLHFIRSDRIGHSVHLRIASHIMLCDGYSIFLWKVSPGVFNVTIIWNNMKDLDISHVTSCHVKYCAGCTQLVHFAALQCTDISRAWHEMTWQDIGMLQVQCATGWLQHSAVQCSSRSKSVLQIYAHLIMGLYAPSWYGTSPQCCIVYSMLLQCTL